MDAEAGCGRNVIAVRWGPDPRVRAATAAAGTLRDAPTTVTGFRLATEVSSVVGEQQWRAILLIAGKIGCAAQSGTSSRPLYCAAPFKVAAYRE